MNQSYLIPVSFLIIVGDRFDEFNIKYGDIDSNENHEHQGQSITQQCKSYVFHLNKRLILRLIDSPDIGDTRGLIQDDKNIDHILAYVNNLSHLNAVCLLLKPNNSRLNVFFRSCINQLFTYLTPISYNNIIFCFTNAQSKFFAPGDTGSALRQLLKKEQKDDIPFAKSNTFCFDSEAFRYLAAKKCNVQFDDFQKQECTNSWTTSVTESIRLLNCILKLDPYNLNEWESPRKTVLEISILARPLMETLRLVLYNQILCETGINTHRMIQNSNSHTSTMCSNCTQKNIKHVGPFWIVEYQRVQNDAISHCQCPFDEKHFLTEFIVKHDFIAETQNTTKENLHYLFDDLLFKYDKLIYFSRQQVEIDPFALVLEQFLDEEQHISDISVHNDSMMNKKVHAILCSIKETRIKNNIRINESNKNVTLNEICQIIDDLKSYEAIEKQINSIKESRQLKMKTSEYQVETNFIKNKTFTKLIT